jgi:hypothetical protein
MYCEDMSTAAIMFERGQAISIAYVTSTHATVSIVRSTFINESLSPHV